MGLIVTLLIHFIWLYLAKEKFTVQQIETMQYTSFINTYAKTPPLENTNDCNRQRNSTTRQEHGCIWTSVIDANVIVL